MRTAPPGVTTAPLHPSCFTFFLTVKQDGRYNLIVAELSEFDRGFLIGLLVGEGSFGGDGKQPQVTLRMHTRHEALFRWLMERFPRTKLYGPYNHGGRSYYQWMARGRTLVEDLLPLLESYVRAELDGHAAARFEEMRTKYSVFIAREQARAATFGDRDFGDSGSGSGHRD